MDVTVAGFGVVSLISLIIHLLVAKKTVDFNFLASCPISTLLQQDAVIVLLETVYFAFQGFYMIDELRLVHVLFFVFVRGFELRWQYVLSITLISLVSHVDSKHAVGDGYVAGAGHQAWKRINTAYKSKDLCNQWLQQKDVQAVDR